MKYKDSDEYKKYEDEYEEYEDIGDSKGFNVFFIVAGIGLIVLSVITLIVISFFPSSYFITALMNIAILPVILGILSIMLGILLSYKKLTPYGILSRVFLSLLFVLVIVSTIRTPIYSVMDLYAINQGDVYVVEGEVIETHIERRSSSSTRGSSGRVKYIQYFTLDNESNDYFTKRVNDREDYQIKLGQKYEVIALPHSKQMLEYKEVSD